MNDFQIDLGDLIPGFTAAVSEAMCDECGKDEAQIDGLCFDCAGDLMCDELGLQERLAA